MSDLGRGWKTLDEAPHDRWLIGWTDCGVRFIRYLTALPNDGVRPLIAGWCTQKNYGNHVFGLGGAEDIVILAWRPMVEGPEGMESKQEAQAANARGLGVRLAYDRNGDLIPTPFPGTPDPQP